MDLHTLSLSNFFKSIFWSSNYVGNIFQQVKNEKIFFLKTFDPRPVLIEFRMGGYLRIEIRSDFFKILT